jgi:hypothetical protein
MSAGPQLHDFIAAQQEQYEDKNNVEIKYGNDGG